MKKMWWILPLALFMGGCAMKPPSEVGDACAIYKERSGLLNSWERQTKKAERRYGVPAPILLATIYQESRFHPRIRPPRKKLMGFIPWKRPSNAYGYAQALKGTWKEFQVEEGKPMARRNRYKHAVQFVGWYHNKTHQRNKVSKQDAYNLYLAYYSGHGGYARRTYANNPTILAAAQRVNTMAQRYDAQLRQCGKR